MAAIDVRAAQRKVLRWFAAQARAFPWRDHRDPYGTLVAEVMLQQTQTARVVPSYVEFMKRFPTLDALAHAPAMDVIRAWKGLGYNRRAVDLQRAVQNVLHDYGGEFPADPQELRALPGVGAYTSSAVACFAFDQQVPVIDVNVTRVLARAAHGRDADRIEATTIKRTAERWLPEGDAYEWNQALMDIGSLFCRIDQPLCAKCPLQASCRFHAAGRHRRPPAPRPAKQSRFEGSNRQKRGGIVDALREAAGKGLALSTLGRALHPQGGDRDLRWLVELLEGLERDGLVRMTDAARRGSPRGTVRLPG